MCGHGHATVCIWKLEDNLKESILPFHHAVCLVEFKSDLRGKHFYQLSYITSPPSLSANILSAVTKKVGTTIPKNDPIVSAIGKLLPAFEGDVPTKNGDIYLERKPRPQFPCTTISFLFFPGQWEPSLSPSISLHAQILNLSLRQCGLQ